MENNQQQKAKAISEIWNDAADAWNNAAVDQKLYNKIIPLIELLRPVAEGKSVIVRKNTTSPDYRDMGDGTGGGPHLDNYGSPFIRGNP